MERLENLEELEKRLADIVRQPGRNTAIIGGHYPINMFGEAETSTDGAFGVFPEYTFGLAARLVAKAREKERSVKIALVVDDHSLMTPLHWYREVEKSPIVAKVVGRYFEDFRIPDNYLAIMATERIDESDFVRATQVLPFQESYFRTIAEKASGKPATCSVEYEGILRRFQEQGIGRVISLIPQRCQGPTCQGAGKFSADSESSIKITHAYLPSYSLISSAEEMEYRVEEDGGIPYIHFG